jgi:8-hydroxy-5-deazaflavin:NADPH oxidoreductase
MRVGILGSGVVGRTLGTGFASHGHDVKIGTQSPSKPDLVQWRSSVKGTASVGSFEEAARHGELLVLACLGTASEEVIRLAGPAQFDGKVLVDATNALDFSKGMPPGLFVGLTDSLGERHQRKLPKARVVKCFNIVPAPVMIHPEIHGSRPSMIIAGNDAGAKSEVERVLKEFGWDGAIDLGGIEESRWLEALVPLWVRTAAKLGNFGMAFRALT